MGIATDRRPASLPPGVRETLRLPVVWLPWVPVAVSTVVFGTGHVFGLETGVGSVPGGEWRYLPLVASVVVLGLPHGAVDWATLPRAVTGRLDGRWIGVVVLLYLVAGGAYGIAWFLVPVASAAVFVGLTWFHWGQGDVYPLVAVLDADHLEARSRRALTAVVRGAIPMVVPLLAFPDRYRSVVASFVAPFGARVTTWPIDPGVRLVLGLAFGVLTVATLAWGSRAADNRRVWAVDAGETALLWLYFLVVPPVFAVGLYFCCWHSARHVARVLPLDERSAAALDGGQLTPALGRFAREAALPTAGGVAVAWVLWTNVPSQPGTLGGIAGLYLVAVATLTLPHVLVVTWLDRTQGIW